MIRFKKILCLLSVVVVAVASEDQYDECALVNELVEQGGVSDTDLLLFNQLSYTVWRPLSHDVLFCVHWEVPVTN